MQPNSGFVVGQASAWLLTRQHVLTTVPLYRSCRRCAKQIATLASQRGSTSCCCPASCTRFQPLLTAAPVALLLPPTWNLNPCTAP
jgi:hypothetical protein